MEEFLLLHTTDHWNVYIYDMYDSLGLACVYNVTRLDLPSAWHSSHVEQAGFKGALVVGLWKWVTWGWPSNLFSMWGVLNIVTQNELFPLKDFCWMIGGNDGECRQKCQCRFALQMHNSHLRERDALRELTLRTQAASKEAETLVLNSF